MTATLAILSWGAPQTLENSLKSYQRYGLDRLFDERMILFQETSSRDRELARIYDYWYVGLEKNSGIANGYRTLAEFARGDYFLFLENDWELIAEPKLQIGEALILLETRKADVIRLRHRQNPGQPLWTRQFEGNEYTRRTHLFDSIHWTDPNKFPEVSSFKSAEEGRLWYYTTSAYANWTNNPTMFRTAWLREHIVPRMGEGNVEQDLQHWWQEQNFLVAQSEGLFTHNRLDR